MALKLTCRGNDGAYRTRLPLSFAHLCLNYVLARFEVRAASFYEIARKCDAYTPF